MLSSALSSFYLLFIYFAVNSSHTSITTTTISIYHFLSRLVVLIVSFNVFYSSSLTCNWFDKFRFWLLFTKMEAMMKFVCENNLHRQPWVNLKAATRKTYPIGICNRCLQPYRLSSPFSKPRLIENHCYDFRFSNFWCFFIRLCLYFWSRVVWFPPDF